MKVALVLGSKSSGEGIKSKLLSRKDNLDMDCYGTVGELVDESTNRYINYDRVVCRSNEIRESNLLDLYDFWLECNKSFDIVMIGTKVKDTRDSKRFLDKFSSVRVAVVLIESYATLGVMADVVLKPLSSLNELYGIDDDFDVEIDNIEVAIDATDGGIGAFEESLPTQSVVVTEESNESDVKKKRSIFGVLFSSEKKKKSVKYSKPDASRVEKLESSKIDEIGTNKKTNEDTPIVDDISLLHNEPEIIEIEEILEGNNDDLAGSVDITSTEIEHYSEQIIKELEKNLEADVDTPSSHQVDDVEPVLDNVVDEVDDLLITSTPEGGVEEVISGTSMHYQEVDSSDLGILDVTKQEVEYRRTVDAPKVIIKEVPIQEDTKKGKRLSVKRGTVIIVTGDRCTGVTTLAYKMARLFAKESQVLYFDCDTELHGLLSYINYDDFSDFEESKLQGIKRCKTTAVFENCVCRLEPNLDVLSTDYSCDVTSEELVSAQMVVAENLIDYGVVIVDCPLSRLQYITDLLLVGSVVLCVEATKRGYLNMICGLSNNSLSLRYKRAMVGRGLLLHTRVPKNTDIKKLRSFISSFLEPGEVDWMSMRYDVFTQVLDSTLIGKILGG